MWCLKDLGAHRVPMVVGDFAGGSIGTILIAMYLKCMNASIRLAGVGVEKRRAGEAGDRGNQIRMVTAHSVRHEPAIRMTYCTSSVSHRTPMNEAGKTNLVPEEKEERLGSVNRNEGKNNGGLTCP